MSDDALQCRHISAHDSTYSSHIAHDTQEEATHRCSSENERERREEKERKEKPLTELKDGNTRHQAVAAAVHINSIQRCNIYQYANHYQMTMC